MSTEDFTGAVRDSLSVIESTKKMKKNGGEKKNEGKTVKMKVAARCTVLKNCVLLCAVGSWNYKLAVHLKPTHNSLLSTLC